MRTRDPKTALGEFIEAARKSAGYKEQAPLAAVLDVSPAYVSKLEGGKATPSPELLAQIVKACKADASRARKLLLAVHECDTAAEWSRAVSKVGVVVP